ncbi:5-formyltetrahydrofolate cyclo-ligase [Streptomyces violaceusniger]|uniref:5-formyltetrahydrofolate cyclo-ligase n=1 Tax=Streptomyces violaceusniger (strain Tu 4113) TaxID=653045 RepID=G2PAH2_STRV4|nr:5-formyltetrahydrofolate cyclo-ligase [Streptomyces violaceusniger]AEM87698.1 5-formyltetrahydrofolate cyclo-ligase [Streptomyces violaceusniger Tu 4113]
MNRAQVQRAKQAVRESVWALLEPTHGDVTGRIPSFIGADSAAARLAEHLAWQAASVIKAVPDKAQLPVRARALQEGKRIYMASPKLATENPFYLLDPENLSIPPIEAAERRTAAKVAQPVGMHEMPVVDLIVCGSVAVNSEGVRLGKGAGYSDIEVALLQEAGLIGPNTLIATTVHPLQVVEEVLPESEHDFRVDIIVTPDETIDCPPHPRPPGIFWEHLAPDSIAAIPALANRKPSNR